MSKSSKTKTVKSAPKKPTHHYVNIINQEMLSDVVSKLTHPIIAIDQAIDRSGIAILFPEIDNGLEYIKKLKQDQGLTEIKKGDEYWFELKRGRSHFGGYTILNSGLCLSFMLEYEPSPDPEWEISSRTASALKGYCSLSNDTLTVIESLALHGSAQSIAILPILGILYSAIFREFVESGHRIAEISNGTWKKIVSGAGNTQKKLIQKQWRELSGVSFSDDETDSLSIAFASAYNIFVDKPEDLMVKYSNGRLRPLPKT